MKKEYLECGQITRAHGINGAMVINPLCDSYEVFAELKTLYLKEEGAFSPLKVKKCSPYKNSAIVLVDGITTPEEVTKLRMEYVYAHRNDILKGEDDFFIVDLIGLEVIDAKTQEIYGTLKDVTNQGAQDLYVVTRENKPDAYIPAIKKFVKEISLEKGIFITPIEGMLD
ncbi:MAG: 16S rRNA processing protein RimM [Ruminococcaceae bacterium]|nr:16S rRNA processing protein RimM [Oscillospiraceae bacterium]